MIKGLPIYKNKLPQNSYLLLLNLNNDFIISDDFFYVYNFNLKGYKFYKINPK